MTARPPSIASLEFGPIRLLQLSHGFVGLVITLEHFTICDKYYVQSAVHITIHPLQHLLELTVDL